MQLKLNLKTALIVDEENRNDKTQIKTATNNTIPVDTTVKHLA